ncbi:hypothetical protein ACWD3I_00595 [Streptomyces sp. NPDC002817]
MFVLCAASLSTGLVSSPPAQAYVTNCGSFWGIDGNDPISYR